MSSSRRGATRPRAPEGKPRASEGERLQKVLAAAGVASRRAAEQLIAAGRVRVDGEVVRTQVRRVDPQRARIEVDGERVQIDPRHEYILLNKPAGYVTTARDPQARPTVLDLVRSARRVYPVGRLDVGTLGLLLLTDHGELAHRLMHPRYGIPRTYLAEVRGRVTREVLTRLRRGVTLEDGPAQAASVRLVRTALGRSQVEVTLSEGRKREVRRMMEAVGHPVSRLVRTRFGPLSLGDLPSGRTRDLTAREVGRLLAAVGL